MAKDPDNKKNEDTSSSTTKALKLLFPETYKLAQKIKNRGNDDDDDDDDVSETKKEKQQTKRDNQELRYTLGYVSNLLRTNNTLIRDQVTLQQKTVNVLENIKKALDNKNGNKPSFFDNLFKKATNTAETLTGGGILSALSKTLTIGTAGVALSGIGLVTSPEEDKILEEAKDKSNDTKEKYGNDLVSKARVEYQPWWKRSSIDANDDKDSEYVEKYLKKNPGTVPVSIPKKTISPQQQTAVPVPKQETAAVKDARDRNLESKNVITFNASDMNFISEKMKFDIDQITINAETIKINNISKNDFTASPQTGGSDTTPRSGGGNISTPQTSGGNTPRSNSGSGSSASPPSGSHVSRQSKKEEQKVLSKEQKEAFASTSKEEISADDPRAKHFSSLSEAQLKSAGIEKTEKGGYRQSPITEKEVDESLSHGKLGTGGLKGTTKTQKQVYDSFINAGYSDNQARALTAEVGRENSYNPDTLFGSHSDPYNKKTNKGMFSWQGDRGDALMEHMKQKKLLNPNGTMIRSQDALDEMARFSKKEIETNSRYKRTREEFLNDPNIDPEKASAVLGDNYIGWRRTDPAYAHHIGIRQRHLRDITKTTTSPEFQDSRGPFTEKQKKGAQERIRRGREESYTDSVGAIGSNKNNISQEISTPKTTQQVLENLTIARNKGLISNDECVALAKASVGFSGPTSEWRKGDSGAKIAAAGVPGVPMATFFDRNRNPSNQYDGGHGGQHARDTIGFGEYGGKDHAVVSTGQVKKDENGEIIAQQVFDQWQGRPFDPKNPHTRWLTKGAKKTEDNLDNYHGIMTQGRDGSMQDMGGKRNPYFQYKRSLETPTPTSIPEVTSPKIIPPEPEPISAPSPVSSGSSGPLNYTPRPKQRFTDDYEDLDFKPKSVNPSDPKWIRNFPTVFKEKYPGKSMNVDVA